MYSNPLILTSNRWQRLQRRLTVLIGLVLPATILLIEFVVSWFLFPLNGSTWLLFGGGMFLLGLIGVWATHRILRQIALQSLNEFQTHLEETDKDENNPTGEGSRYSANNKLQAGLSEAELATGAPESGPAAVELEEIEARFRQLSTVSFEGIAIHNKIYLISANQTLADMFGYKPSEIINMNALGLVTSESHSIVLRNILAKYEGPFEAIGLKRDGTTFPIEMFSRAITYQGHTIRAMGIRELTGREPAEVVKGLQEVKQELEAEVKRSTTELRYSNERLQLELKARQQAEAALRESEERYRQLVEFSPYGIIIHSEDQIAFINGAGAKILGAAESGELIGKKILDFVNLDDQQVMIQQLRQGNLGASPVQQKFIRLDRTPIEVEVLNIPFVYKNRPAVQLVVRDITERKKAEAEIAQRNRELMILQAAGVAITSRLDLRYVLDTVAQEMAQLLEVESCAIFDWHQAENTVTQMARYGTRGWWDPKSEAEVFNLTEYPLTKSVLEEQIPEQMTVSRHDIDPSELGYMKRTHLKTLLMLPMIFQRRVLGLVKLEDSQVERTFTYQEISLAKLLASQAASAIENARLFDELRQRVAELTTLNKINQAITSTLDLQEMLTLINQHIIQLLNVATSSVVLYNELEHSLWVAAVSGEGSNLVLDKQLPLGEGVVGWVIRHSQAVLVPDLSKDARFDSIFEQEHTLMTRSILCVPLQTKGKMIGAIEVRNKADEVFNQADLRLLQSVAAPAATAIDNARLFEQAQAEIRERLRAEAALEEERALLARRVKERTAELSKANAELARASRLKDEFLAGMSHELRTPLNSILGFSEILQMGAFGDLNERQLKYTHNIEESGRHLLLLINDILDISKVEAGKLELEIGPVSVASVCEASLRLVKELAHQKQLQVATKFNNITTILQADERRLKQILVNLLSNAIKFTPEGGKIGLEVSENTEKQAILFTVWDTGIGIAGEDLRRLFQPFVQLDSSLARQYAGTGLGLSLVLRLVELHRGGIAVDSEVGQGSRFTVSLPCSRLPVSISHDSDVQPAVIDKPAMVITKNLKAGEGPLVLLVDDNEDHINLIFEFLQVQGCQVVAARNGSEAITQAREEKPDIILMDIQMPGMDGLEATRRLRADGNLANIPIIALTALAMPGDRERCLEAGANDYLSKPVSPSELVKKIESFLTQ